MNNPTVIYVRRQSQQPEASDCMSMPRRGAPIGVIAYNYVLEMDSEDRLADSYLEFSFALANSKHDVFNRKLSREIVLKRLELKRDYAEKNGKPREPSFNRFDVPQQEATLRPYDALRLIVRGNNDGIYILPPRLVSSISQMLSDNVLRNQRLSYLQSEGRIVEKVRELMLQGVSSDSIMNQLSLVRVDSQPLESLAPETLVPDGEEEFILPVVEATR